MSNEQRAEKLAAAKRLLSNEIRAIEPDALGAAPSPFTADLGKERAVAAVVEKTLVSDEELLGAFSKSIQPTAIFQFGGEYYLIFKEKKIKAGSEYGVLYQGTEYSVNVAEITRNAYTITYGDAQLQLKLK